MADYITGIETAEGVKKYDYNSLANLPESNRRIADVTLLASGWVGTSSPYEQVVNIAGVTPYTQVDLTPSVQQLSIFYNKSLAFVTENINGVVTVYALGDKPTGDYVIQATLTEVAV